MTDQSASSETADQQKTEEVQKGTKKYKNTTNSLPTVDGPSAPNSTEYKIFNWYQSSYFGSNGDRM